MLTPAEELGLSGLGLASRVRKAFFRIPESRLVELTGLLREEARRRHLYYLRDGQVDVCHVMPLPVTVLPDQLSYAHYVSQIINNALKRLPELYIQDFAVRELLKVSPGEEQWLWDCWGPNQRENNPVFGRLDAMIDFISPMWKDSLKFVEPNMAGIGGLHMIPNAEEMVAAHVLPVLKELDGSLQLEPGRDIRELLIQEMLDHLQTLGRPGAVICLIEPKYAGSGPDEQAFLAQYYHERHGLTVLHADPSELELRDGEVCYQGQPIDLGYRDYSVLDLLALEKTGASIEPMRRLFQQNRIVSSIAAELDQKSCFEILTDPQFTQKYFSAEERQIFRRHILWTRIVSDRATTFPDGTQGPLLDFIRREQDRLVLKPNRAYGGEGVAIGHLASAGEWDATLQKALRDPERWVVQRLASIPVSEFPVVVDGPAHDGIVHFEPFYTVMGFAATKYGVSILGRASQKQVVNVAQRGGLCVLMNGRLSSPFHGPGPSRTLTTTSDGLGGDGI
jgi:hypothetical protein